MNPVQQFCFMETCISRVEQYVLGGGDYCACNCFDFPGLCFLGEGPLRGLMARRGEMAGWEQTFSKETV